MSCVLTSLKENAFSVSGNAGNFYVLFNGRTRITTSANMSKRDAQVLVSLLLNMELIRQGSEIAPKELAQMFFTDLEALLK